MTGGICGRATVCQGPNKIANKTQAGRHPEAAQIWRKMKLGAKGRNGKIPNRCLLLLMFDPAAKAESRGD